MILSSSHPDGKKISNLFTYDLTRQASKLQLKQQETHFTLTIHQKGGQITQFRLADSPYLSENSPCLYDAALIELTIEGLQTLYTLGHQTPFPLFHFSLCPFEAEALKDFSFLFHSFTQTDTRVFMKFPTSAPAYQRYQGYRQQLLTKIGQELWQQQRQDELIKTYWQKQKTGTFFPLTQTLPEKKNNVICFPLPSQKR